MYNEKKSKKKSLQVTLFRNAVYTRHVFSGVRWGPLTRSSICNAFFFSCSRKTRAFFFFFYMRLFFFFWWRAHLLCARRAYKTQDGNDFLLTCAFCFSGKLAFLQCGYTWPNSWESAFFPIWCGIERIFN